MCTSHLLVQSLFVADAWDTRHEALDELRAIPLAQLLPMLDRLVAAGCIRICVDVESLAAALGKPVITTRPMLHDDLAMLGSQTLAGMLAGMLATGPKLAAAAFFDDVVEEPPHPQKKAAKRRAPRPGPHHPWNKDARDGVQKWRERHEAHQ
ncbi:MAG: hypothetical protein A3F73_09270 [Gallionellales bacterium RIFCSPLOWO2_12_FULL_59_22]|nr:MAG: hypothetical protein A3H99_04005 [Gallionellales bacterium RIFCSPLOWO2_02_FULL_59_110]OGT14601.1 MAG: hypothetical protein A3F73_09270 [Gallionellales bacterium RIFCSPLOWO2_12_FULL_59_22]